MHEAWSRGTGATVHKRFSWFALGVLIFNLAVISWGALVRATGSGAGCGHHWPTCNGEIIPQAPSIHTLIEFTHRLTSGLALIAVLGMGVWAFKVHARGSPARRAAGAAMIFILLEAAVGAGLVLFRLVADNDSIPRAMFMSVHLLNTYLLLASIALTWWWSRTRADRLPPAHSPDVWLMLTALLGLMVVGVSGAVAALGDTLFPSLSLEEALRADLSATSHVFIRLRLFHPVLAIITSFIVVACVVWLPRFRATPHARWWSHAVLVLVSLQVIAGAINVALLAPVWMQLLHLLLADLGWISLVLACTCALTGNGPTGPMRRPQT